MYRILILLCLAGVTGFVSAQEPVAPDPNTRPPLGEPEVTIIKRDDHTIEEYRVKGRLYMVKIMPRKGFAYYLIDTDGDGQLDTRQNELDEGIQVPQWILFEWK